MPFIVRDRVRDTSLSTGTGTFTVSGSAPTGFDAFADVCQIGDTLPYFIQHRSQNEWEVGIATYSNDNELTRSIILESSAGDAIVNFSAGVKDVVLGYPADLSLITGPESSVASDSTTDIGASKSIRQQITGDTTIESFGAVANAVRFLRFTGSPLIKHNSTSLVLPGGQDLKMKAGDTLVAISDPSGNWRVYGGTGVSELLGLLSQIKTKTENHILDLTDRGATIEMDVEEENTLTVPAHSDVPLPIGTYVNWTQVGEGTTTIVAAEGVTINSRNGLVSGGQWAGGTLYKRDEDEWVALGDLTE